MSEDKIIEHVEYSLLNPCFNNGNSTIINNEDLKGLLDLYNKEKEKNKEMINIKDIEFSNFINERYISKDKIRAKREEYEQLAERNKDGKYWTDESILYDRQAEALRELEEE